MPDALLTRPEYTAQAETIQITVHRSTILSDIIKQFKENKSSRDLNLRMVFQVIDNKGENEKGAGIGVVCDVIAMFWGKFYDALTDGAQVRIPTIRHGYHAEEWESGNVACDSEEIMDILSSFGVRQQANNNVREIFIKLAHNKNNSETKLYYGKMECHFSTSEGCPYKWH